MRVNRYLLLSLGAVVGLAACQPNAAAPSVGPSGVPTGDPAATPSPSGTPAGAPSATAAPTATPAPQRFSVVGGIYNEAGRSLEGASITIDSDDPAFRGSQTAAGGAFGIRDVPVGTTLTITATAPGFTTRTRTLKVREIPPFDTTEGNRLDFGGNGSGYFYYLTDELEIARVTPGNRATGVKTNPLEIAFEFSAPIRAEQQGRFENLVRVRVPAVGGEQLLRLGTAFGRERVRFDWSEDGRTVTMRFLAPIVTRQVEAALTVDFDPSVDAEDWPEDDDGRRLGIEIVAATQDGTGAVVRDRIAPIAFLDGSRAIPSTRPSPLALWGLTHATTNRFELARDLSPLKAESARALPGASGEDDYFEIRFNKPMNGFPSAALSIDTTTKSNYRFVIGRTSDKDDRERFEEEDPRKSGSLPSLGVEFDANDPYIVRLHDRAGAFGDNRRFKLFVDPKVEDIAGVALGGDGVVLEGNI